MVGPQRVLDVLGVLLCRALGIPHQPVWAPAVFENLLVEQAEHLDRDAHVVWAAVLVPVEDFGTLVGGRIGGQGLDVGERIHDGFRRCLDHDLP